MQRNNAQYKFEGRGERTACTLNDFKLDGSSSKSSVNALSMFSLAELKTKQTPTYLAFKQLTTYFTCHICLICVFIVKRSDRQIYSEHYITTKQPGVECLVCRQRQTDTYVINTHTRIRMHIQQNICTPARIAMNMQMRMQT